MQWSKYQEAIFEFIANGTGNGFVGAGPGSGKTTVIEESVHRVPSDENILLAAFNVSIRDELDSRLGHLPNVEVHNFNRFGFRMFKQNVHGYVKVDKDKSINLLFFEVFDGKNTSQKDKTLYYRIKHPVSRIIGLCKANMIWNPTTVQIEALMEEHGITLHKEVPIDVFVEKLKATYDLSWERRNKIDFDDQIAMPVYFDWDIPKFNRVLVDEAQDMSPVQIEMMIRACTNRSLWVGDQHQTIYQFRGASKNAVQSIVTRLGCTVLPLSICYRCSRKVVEEAQKIYPDIEVSPTAAEGNVTSVKRAELRARLSGGEFILCRTSAPLVSECLSLIAAGIPAVVKGRDLGEDLIALLPEADTEISAFLESINSELQPRIAKLNVAGKADQALNLQDRLDCLVAVASVSDGTADMKARIDKMFTDNKGRGVTLMTVHKSKGLETEVVYILRPELMPHPKATDLEAEMNIKWVATTRAKRELVYVEEPARK